MTSSHRPPPFSPELSTVVFTQKVLPSGLAWAHVERLIGAERNLQQAPGLLTGAQARWLARAPYDLLRPYVRDIYEALDRMGLRNEIPNENKARAIREDGWRPS